MLAEDPSSWLRDKALCYLWYSRQHGFPLLPRAQEGDAVQPRWMLHTQWACVTVELGHMIMEAEKSNDLPPASWRSRKASV